MPNDSLPPELITHDFRLSCQTRAGLRLLLRPLAETDWETLRRWNNDPEVLYFAEEDDVRERSLADVQAIYRQTSQNGILFMAECSGRPIGECWLQRMNLPEYETCCRGRDCRRIDIAIGEKVYWGTGVGTAVVAELTRFGFVDQRADAIYCCGVADYNVRSRGVAIRTGYRLIATHRHPEGSKMRYTEDFAMTSEEYLQLADRAPP
jgi:RimJ/RimL family protein N-acetyltransferase